MQTKVVEAVKKDGTIFRIKLCVSEVSLSLSLSLSLSFLLLLSLYFTPYSIYVDVPRILSLLSSHARIFSSSPLSPSNPLSIFLSFTQKVLLGSMKVWIGLMEKILPNKCVVTLNEFGCIVTADAFSESLFGFSAKDLFGVEMKKLIPGSISLAHSLSLSQSRAISLISPPSLRLSLSLFHFLFHQIRNIDVD